MIKRPGLVNYLSDRSMCMHVVLVHLCSVSSLTDVRKRKDSLARHTLRGQGLSQRVLCAATTQFRELTYLGFISAAILGFTRAGRQTNIMGGSSLAD